MLLRLTIFTNILVGLLAKLPGGGSVAGKLKIKF